MDLIDPDELKDPDELMAEACKYLWAALASLKDIDRKLNPTPPRRPGTRRPRQRGAYPRRVE